MQSHTHSLVTNKNKIQFYSTVSFVSSSFIPATVHNSMVRSETKSYHRIVYKLSSFKLLFQTGTQCIVFMRLVCFQGLNALCVAMEVHPSKCKYGHFGWWEASFHFTTDSRRQRCYGITVIICLTAEFWWPFRWPG